MSTLPVPLPHARRQARPAINLRSILALVLKRGRANWLLALVTFLGMLVCAALAAAIPMYAEAVLTANLRRELSAVPADQIMPRSALLATYRPGQGPATLPTETYREASDYFRTQPARLAGLPIALSTRYAQTEALPLQVGEPASAPTMAGAQTYAPLVFLTGLEEHVEILEGRLPRASTTGGGAIEAMVSTELLDELGIKVGGQIQAMVPGLMTSSPVPVRVVGRWYPKDDGDPYWFNRQDYYQKAVFVPEETFWGPLQRLYPGSAKEYGWYSVYDTRAVRAGQVGHVLSGMERLRSDAARVLKGVRVETAPDEILARYQQRLFQLQVLLFALSAPILLVVILFVAATMGMSIERQRGEIAILKSRGATTIQVVSTYLLEGLLMLVLVVLPATALAILLTQLIGQSDTFLGFSSAARLPLSLNLRAFTPAIVAAAFGIAASLVPVLGAARLSIVSYKQEVTRSLRPPLWQRAFLDLLPLPAAGYTYLLLSQKRSILPVGDAGDTFADPLLLLAPAILILALALALLRILPLVIRLVERLASPVLPMPLLLAVRQLARQTSHYFAPLLLVTLTSAVGLFSASMAATLDRNYTDSATYRVGADLRLQETGVYDKDHDLWSFVPLSDHLATPGARAAARVATVKAGQQLGTQKGELSVMGIDPLEFPSVAHWRKDYAARPLEALLNDLSSYEASALIDRGMLNDYKLAIGDQLDVTINDQRVEFLVAGVVDYFPTLYPNEGHFMVTNLDYLYSQVPAWPYDVWMSLAPGADGGQVARALADSGVPVVRYDSLAELQRQERRSPSRLGVFGLLSAGFIVCLVLSALAMPIYSYLSFGRRAGQFGILRATGLSLRQLRSAFLLEQAFVTISAVAAGTGVGLVTAWLFIPFFQVRFQQGFAAPPFLVTLDWRSFGTIYAALGVVFLLVLGLSLWLFNRMRIHEAIRFGEER